MRPHIENLERKRIDLLRQIKKERKLIIIAADKNLGPCIMEIEYYIERCLTDHLLNTANYRKISKGEATAINVANFEWICNHFIDATPSTDTFTKLERDYFFDVLCGDRDGLGYVHIKKSLQLPYFYALPKVHKEPFQTRPVVSGVSSILNPLSKWTDAQLQRVVHLCPAYLKDSWQFLNDIKDLKDLKDCDAVISDATAMYTNINTDHAIHIIELWFELHKDDIPKDFPRKLVLLSIRRLMSHNAFTFGSSFYIQENGTAMGTSCACMYATIYYSYHEETRIMKLPNVRFYRRLIDDAFILYKKSGSMRDLRDQMNDFGPPEKRLNWVTEDPKQSVDYLDLTVSITDKGTITTRTYQKKRNCYLYRPPTSAQPESILYSLIFGTLHRYWWQNTYKEDFSKYCALFHDRLIARGHTLNSLHPLFMKAAKAVESSTLPNPRPGSIKRPDNNRNLLFIHLPFSPQHPPTRTIRKLTDKFSNDLDAAGCTLERIILAFSKGPNIGNLCKKHKLEPEIITGLV